MSRESLDDDERQYHPRDPRDRLWRDIAQFHMAAPPSFNPEVTPSSPSYTPLPPIQTHPYAAQFVQSSSPGQLGPVQNQYGQSHQQNQHGQSVPWQNHPLQNQSLQGHPIQNQPPQIQPMQIQPPLPDRVSSTLIAGDLVGCLRAAGILLRDLQHLDVAVGPRLSDSDWEPVDQLVRSHKLMEWLHRRTTLHLLVHGDQRGGTRMSGLSVFCKSLREVLASHSDHFIPLLFFCGMHATAADGGNPTGTPSDPSVGAYRLIRSFVSQFLERKPTIYGNGIDMYPGELASILNGDFNALCDLFLRLLRGLPPNFTVFVLVDGVEWFVRDELDIRERVILLLLEMARSGLIPAPVKVMLTSPTGASHLRRWVHHEAILPLTDIGRAGQLSVTDSAGLRSRLASVIAGRNQEPNS